MRIEAHGLNTHLFDEISSHKVTKLMEHIFGLFHDFFFFLKTEILRNTKSFEMRADLLCFRNWGVDTLSLNQCDNINYFESTINV